LKKAMSVSVSLVEPGLLVEVVELVEVAESGIVVVVVG
jgi:hypothetical protein